MTGLAGLHFVAVYLADDPSIAARGASAALTLLRWLQRDQRSAALLVLKAAAARTRIVSPDSHSSP
jgi:hypothetical protein